VLQFIGVTLAAVMGLQHSLAMVRINAPPVLHATVAATAYWQQRCMLAMPPMLLSILSPQSGSFEYAASVCSSACALMALVSLPRWVASLRRPCSSA